MALAEKFLWEVLLTPKWDHVFEGFPILPRELSFCPTERNWYPQHQLNRKTREPELVRMVSFHEQSTKSLVLVSMAEEKMEVSSIWVPDGMGFILAILDKSVRERMGYDRISSGEGLIPLRP